jgi:DNA-binding response OmpR family regulator
VIQDFADQNSLIGLSERNLAAFGRGSGSAGDWPGSTAFKIVTDPDQLKLLNEEIKLVEADLAAVETQRKNGKAGLAELVKPKLDGFALCAELRRLSNPVPVLMLTAKGQVEDRVTGLDAGADDYLVKPFSTDELLARVRALLRRTRKQGRTPTTLKLGDAQIDLLKQTASRGRKVLHLTAKEFAMLRLMAEAHGEPVTRERFLDVVWGYTAFPTTRTVDNHIASLRSKVENDPDEPRWIKTVHGVGYRLELPN